MIRKFTNIPKEAIYDVMDSPVGALRIIATDAGLHAIMWDVDTQELPFPKQMHPIIEETKRQLSEYFAGTRRAFDLPLAIDGTPFQKRVWQELAKIPYGETISYGEQARRIGDKNKARAVGCANGHNPLSIVIPCHRVIGASGKLTGFAGGLDKKSHLLELESNLVRHPRPDTFA
ncbi:MAG: methylated-DNA--[protein]-cysteine S-methyltransferase [Simkaniaceae bacterium]|nr:methylated-DNA--[protein]-cysteine S-methyltransferase [Simkaniaceae bacterium]